MTRKCEIADRCTNPAVIEIYFPTLFGVPMDESSPNSWIGHCGGEHYLSYAFNMTRRWRRSDSTV